MSFVVYMARQGTTHPAAPRSRLDHRWTYEEMLAELPETNQPVELWAGQLLMSPTPTPRHQTATFRMAMALNEFVTARRMGQVLISPLDVVLSPTQVVQPDVMYISESRLHVIQDRLRGAPDLAVEILSRGSSRRDRVDKKALYEQHGVAEYWIADIEERSIEVLTLVAGVYQLSSRATGAEAALSKQLDGFSISPDQLDPPRPG